MDVLFSIQNIKIHVIEGKNALHLTFFFELLALSPEYKYKDSLKFLKIIKY